MLWQKITLVLSMIWFAVWILNYALACNALKAFSMNELSHSIVLHISGITDHILWISINRSIEIILARFYIQWTFSAKIMLKHNSYGKFEKVNHN